MKFLLKLTIIFLFLPAFAFMLGARSYRYFFILILSFFAIYISFNFKKFIIQTKNMLVMSPLKYLIYFLIYIIIDSFILCLNGIYDGKFAIVYLSQFIILYIFPCYLLSAYFIPKYLNFKKFQLLYLICFYSILLFGAIEIIGKLANIQLFVELQRFIANERVLEGIKLGYEHRLCSTFAEPGWFAGFLFLNFPILYNSCSNNFKISNNNMLNFLLKKTLIPLAWFDLLLTMSPIWLIFCLIQVIYIFRKKIIKLIFNLKIFTFLCLLFIFLIILLMVLPTKNIEQISRIINTLISIYNFNVFVIVEPSLAARIVSYINLLRLAFENIFLGVGLNNSPVYMVKMFATSPVPFTEENYFKYLDALKTGRQAFNGSIFYQTFAETGIFGISLFFTFILKGLNELKKTSKLLQPSLYKCFHTGVEGSVVALLFYSFYDSSLSRPYLWFLLGLVFSCVNYAKVLAKRQEIDK